MKKLNDAIKTIGGMTVIATFICLLIGIWSDDTKFWGQIVSTGGACICLIWLADKLTSKEEV